MAKQFLAALASTAGVERILELSATRDLQKLVCRLLGVLISKQRRLYLE